MASARDIEILRPLFLLNWSFTEQVVLPVEIGVDSLLLVPFLMVQMH